MKAGDGLKNESVGGHQTVWARVMLPAVCLILGFGITLQIRSVRRTQSAVAGADLTRAEELQNQLSAQKSKNDELTNEIAGLQKKIAGSSAAGAQLTQAEMMAGLVDVRGPGLTVTMRDSALTPPAGQNASAFVIHDSDILSVLNELRDAGAEALSINDERILSTSEVRCAGNTLSVNNNRYAAPFVIRAIGDKDKLRSALLMKGGVVDVLSQWGIGVDIAPGDSILVKAYAGIPDYKYAKPANGGS